MDVDGEEMALARLVRQARDDDAAVVDLEAAAARWRQARAAQCALAHLRGEQLREVLRRQRTQVGGRP